MYPTVYPFGAAKCKNCNFVKMTNVYVGYSITPFFGNLFKEKHIYLNNSKRSALEIF